MNYDLTQGNILKNLLKFSFPIMVGNVLQQLYNVVDTLIVGRYLGKNALAAVGSSYTLMVFVTSIILGLSWAAVPFFRCSLAGETMTDSSRVSIWQF